MYLNISRTKVFTCLDSWLTCVGLMWYLHYSSYYKIARAAVVHLNLRARSTFPVPVCTVPSSMDRNSRCNKVDAVRLYASYRLNLLLLKGQRCVMGTLRSYVFIINHYKCYFFRNNVFYYYLVCITQKTRRYNLFVIINI